MSAEVYYQWTATISVITAILTLVGLIFACVQLRQIKKNRVRQFDQARREKTVELVLQYVKDNDSLTRAIEKVVSQFSEEQCFDLYNLSPFEIDDKVRRRICGICPYRLECQKLDDKELRCCQGNDKKFYVKGDILYFLRGGIVRCLNALECVLLAWQLGIVDQAALEEQFAFLDRNGGDRAVKAFRNVAGNGRAYPAIEKFYQRLDQRKEEAAAATLKDILS